MKAMSAKGHNASGKSQVVPRGYVAWLAEVKQRIRSARTRAVVQVNGELLHLYWTIGRDILARQKREGWGAQVVDRLARDLRREFPAMAGFSARNLKYMRAFAAAWPDESFVQQPAAQLPWFHHCVLLDKLESREERAWYLAAAAKHGWSRNVLAMQIESGAHQRTGKAVTNFESRLRREQSDLARELLKDPYKLDFLGLGDEAQEREVEQALMTHLTQFLLELGSGFAFVGRQVTLTVGGEEFRPDLLFYHLGLRCFVVVELKAGDFKPEHAGKLNFYLAAVDALRKTPADNPTIGLLLCKSRNRVVAEYALRGANKPMGVAEYKLVRSLPTDLKKTLPTIRELEAELAAAPEGTAGRKPQ